MWWHVQSLWCWRLPRLTVVNGRLYTAHYKETPGGL